MMYHLVGLVHIFEVCIFLLDTLVIWHYLLDMKELVKALVASGQWDLVSQKNHFKLRHVSGKGQITCALTESDYRAVKNVKSIVRRIESEALA